MPGLAQLTQLLRSTPAVCCRFDCNVTWPWPATDMSKKARPGLNRPRTTAPKALDLGEVLTNVTAAPIATGGSLAWGTAPVTPAAIPF